MALDDDGRVRRVERRSEAIRPCGGPMMRIVVDDWGSLSETVLLGRLVRGVNLSFPSVWASRFICR